MIQDTLLGLFKIKPNPNEMMFVAKVISSVDIVDDDDDQMDIIARDVSKIKSDMAELMREKLEWKYCTNPGYGNYPHESWNYDKVIQIKSL